MFALKTNNNKLFITLVSINLLELQHAVNCFFILSLLITAKHFRQLENITLLTLDFFFLLCFHKYFYRKKVLEKLTFAKILINKYIKYNEQTLDIMTEHHWASVPLFIFIFFIISGLQNDQNVYFF